MSTDLDAFFDSVEGPSLRSPAVSSSGGGGGDVADSFLGEEAGVPDAPADDVLQRMRAAITFHTQQLRDMRETLSDSTSEAWHDENNAIAIAQEPYDGLPILALVQSDNAQFNKVTMVFAYLSDEIRSMKAMAAEKFYGPLTMFGHEFGAATSDVAADELPKSSVPPPEKQPPEMEMGAFLPVLQELANFVKRLYAMARNLVNQLACLYHERQKLWMSTFRHIHLDLPFHALGELAAILVTLDAIVLDNPNFSSGWTMFKRMIKYIRADPTKYGMTDALKLRVFENLLLSLDRLILSGNMFQTLLEMDFGLQQSGGSAGAAPQSTAATLVAGNKVLYETLSNFLRSWYKRLTTGLGESVETYPRQQIVEMFSLYALQRSLFRATMKPDKSFFTDLWLLQKKVPIIPLFGRACWFVADFLGKFAPVEVKNLTPSGKGILQLRMELLTASDESFAAKTEELYNQLAVWLVRMESDLAPSHTHNISTVLNARAKLLLNGLLLSQQLRNLLCSNLFLHLHLRESFRAKNIRSYAVCTEMLKAIQLTYERRSGMISENMAHMLGQTSFTLKRLLSPIKKKLDTMKKLDDAKLDLLAAINLSLQLLDQPPTKARLMLLRFTTAVAQFDGLMHGDQVDELKYQQWKLEQLAGWQGILIERCDTSYLYWISNLVPAMLNDIFDLSPAAAAVSANKGPEPTNQGQRLQYLFVAFNDCAQRLFNPHASPPTGDDAAYRARAHALQVEYRNEILGHFTAHILNPLCREVETDLRLHIHSVVLQQANLRQTTRIKDLSQFLNLRPLPLFDTRIDVRARVTHYLDSIFYNLNTVALHDWRIYAEMRNLAHEKYGLNLTEVHLPGTAHYSEALDVLEIMRNIHIFVSRYHYNMNTQVFVERAFDQKHLHTINIYHISDSLRTHGTGIMNTTVNFTYQFLTRKFKIFSEFLFDDHIKSRLIKQQRFFRAEREKLNSRFPYEVAERFLRDIRKLGVAEDGTTFLDQFRRQISEIGNALGYVRMVRSGGLHHVSQSIKFIPRLDSIPRFHDNAVSEGLGVETQQAARNLDQVLQDLIHSFSEGTEYFQLLVKVFQPVLMNEQQTHLSNFYAIVPALTLNFVEKMLAQKEKLGKTSGGGRQESSFTDDGFALGLAYILRILEQNSAFDSLHWFESVNNFIASKRVEGTKLKAAAERATQRANGSSSSSSSSRSSAAARTASEDELLAHAVSLKKLSQIQIEFDLFFYSFSGATIFFQDASNPQQAKGENKPAEEGAQAPAAPADANGAPAAPPAPAADVPVPPPLDAGAYVTSSGAPPAPPMMDAVVIGAGAPPPPPPPDF